jgi:Fic family protein
LNFSELDALKVTLDTHRPLSSEMVQNLHEDMILRWTYHSNAIEGNTLSLQETKVALEGITVGGKTLREHFEVINHKEAILYVEALVQKGALLSENDIKSLHALVLKNIDTQNAGVYRHINVVISGAVHKPPHFVDVVARMEALMTWYRDEAQALHPVERAARVHADFVGIHPFVDGNGRTSRLLMNIELLKAGFPAAILKAEHRLNYYEALDLIHTSGEYEPFIQLVAQAVTESFEPYYYALGI